jgi:hypothetical protein
MDPATTAPLWRRPCPGLEKGRETTAELIREKKKPKKIMVDWVIRIFKISYESDGFIFQEAE